MIIFSKKLVAYFSVVDQVDDFLSISTSNGLVREMATGCGVEPAAIHIIKQI
mgnify:CR=1 FL=1